ncbi:uncharacterized protein [Nicotiana sylvestris]|uniref:uncharacterized protein n=1 Tax=Nicotiana sylvestris TaxID=4096 RepID=UPI00388CA2EF
MVTANASISQTTPTLAPTKKPGKFFGIDFKRWQQKMFFYLSTLSLHIFIKDDVPVLHDEAPDNERFVVTGAWKHFDFWCNNYILSRLEDELYQVHELQVNIHDFLAECTSQINTYVKSTNYIIITNQIFIEGLVINEEFQIVVMIDKLSPLWKDFKNYLKYKCKEMSLEDLIVRLRIEEDNKALKRKVVETQQ